MPERNLKYLKKSDFGGVRSRRRKRKPNQLYVYDIAIQCFDFQGGPHFNQLPAQLILEIFKYLWAYELLRKVSLVCKYWYNLCRDRALWTSITWNGSPGTLGHLLQLTKYQVHELVLTDNLFTFSDEALARLLKKCTHLKCLKLPRNAHRELFQREFPRTNIVGGIRWIDWLWDDLQMSYDRILKFRINWLPRNKPLTFPIPWFSHKEPEDIKMAHSSVEHKRFLTPEEFFSQHRKGNRFSQHPDKTFSIELKSLECVLQRHRVTRSVRIYKTVTKSPRQSSIRNIPFQGCRMDIRQHQPCKRKPRPPKGQSNQHKEVRMFRRLQKRFKVYSLK